MRVPYLLPSLAISGFCVLAVLFLYRGKLEMVPPTIMASRDDTYVPADVLAKVGQQSVLKGMVYDYLYGASPGRRWWLQVDKSTWIELEPNGNRNIFPIVGRQKIDGVDGTVVLRLATIFPQGNFSASSIKFEVFLPDLVGESRKSYRRVLLGANWETWAFMGVMTEL